MDTTGDVRVAGKPHGDVSRIFHDEFGGARATAPGRSDSVSAAGFNARALNPTVALFLDDHRAAMTKQALVGGDTHFRTLDLAITCLPL